MKVYEAVNEPNLDELYNSKYIKVFLAGGITKCPDWQAEVIKYLENYNDTERLIIFNPRRKDFDITDKNASKNQIKWEFKYLNNMDIFSMYFANSESDQPICMYELGRHLERMQHRFPKDWRHRIIIGIEDGYSRATDVNIQTKLVIGDSYTIMNDVNPEVYADRIWHKYNLLRRLR